MFRRDAPARVRNSITADCPRGRQLPVGAERGVADRLPVGVAVDPQDPVDAGRDPRRHLLQRSAPAARSSAWPSGSRLAEPEANSSSDWNTKRSPTTRRSGRSPSALLQPAEEFRAVLLQLLDALGQRLGQLASSPAILSLLRRRPGSRRLRAADPGRFDFLGDACPPCRCAQPRHLRLRQAATAARMGEPRSAAAAHRRQLRAAAVRPRSTARSAASRSSPAPLLADPATLEPRVASRLLCNPASSCRSASASSRRWRPAPPALACAGLRGREIGLRTARVSLQRRARAGEVGHFFSSERALLRLAPLADLAP